MDDFMHIAIGTDDNYAYGAMVLITSLHKNISSPNKVHIHLGYVEADLSKIHRAALKRLCMDIGFRFSTHAVKPVVSLRKRHISRTAFLKFHFIETIDRPFFWIDSDIVATEGWGDLFTYLSTKKGGDFVVAANIKGPSARFNSGVIGRKTSNPLVLDGWKKMISNNKGATLDQDVFRTLLKNRVTFTPHFFNKTEYWGSAVLESVSPEGRLHHYVGPVKPWHLSVEKRKICIDAGCSWSHWFISEQYLLKIWKGGPWESYLDTERWKQIDPAKSQFIQRTLLNPSKTKASLLLLRFVANIPLIERLAQRIFALEMKNMHPLH